MAAAILKNLQQNHLEKVVTFEVSERMWPKDWGRRSREIGSGYSYVLVRAVLQELQHPSLANEQELEQLRNPRGYVRPLLTSFVSAVGSWLSPWKSWCDESP
eukprot:s1185_g3.t1